MSSGWPFFFLVLLFLIEVFIPPTFAAAVEWNLRDVHSKLETNARKVEKGAHIEGRSGQISDQIRRHQRLALERRAKTVCETGFNAGHSAASWLKNSRADAVYYGFDAGRMFHRYPEENAKLLNELVGKDANGENRVRVTFGDSTKTLPEFVKRNRNTVICDLVHVDGGHFGDVPRADLWGMFQLSNRDTLLIMDDLHCTATWCKIPVQEWEKAKEEGWVKESGCRRYAFNPTRKKGRFPRGFCWGKYLYDGQYAEYENENPKAAPL